MYNLDKETYLGNTKKTFNHSNGISLIETEYQEKVFEGWHSHKNAHITLFLKGGTLEKRKKEDIPVVPGKILFYHSDEIHLNQNTLFPSKNINLELDETFLKTHEISEECIKKATENSVKTKFLLLKIYHEYHLSDSFSNDSITMLFSEFAHSFASQHVSHKIPHWVILIEELLNDRWNETISLEEISRILNINPISISKHFPKYFGCTFGEYCRSLKIDRSLHLLHQSKCSLTEISFECGFADQSHFTRTFKQQTGFLPKKYQKL